MKKVLMIAIGAVVLSGLMLLSGGDANACSNNGSDMRRGVVSCALLFQQQCDAGMYGFNNPMCTYSRNRGGPPTRHGYADRRWRSGGVATYSNSSSLVRRGYLPSVDCASMGGRRVTNPNTGRPSCFVPNR